MSKSDIIDAAVFVALLPVAAVEIAARYVVRLVRR